jgi:hypothetical protein
MTLEDLERIRALCDAATPGPWESFVEGRDHSCGSDFIGTQNRKGPDIELSGASHADQDFIAMARQALPRLVAEIERLKELGSSITLHSAKSDLKWLDGWYSAQCDGDWEHHNGITIQSLDNPGWLLSVDLVGTGYEAAALSQVVLLTGEPPSEKNGNRGSSEWIRCEAKDGKFIGAGGAASLVAILDCFRGWIEAQRGVR